MKHAIHLEHRASSSQSKHEGESSFGLCDRLDRTRVNSQRQLPTDHDYAVPTREYQTDQSSLKPAQAAARSVFGKKQKQRQRQKQPRRYGEVDTVTPYRSLTKSKSDCRPVLLSGPEDGCERNKQRRAHRFWRNISLSCAPGDGWRMWAVAGPSSRERIVGKKRESLAGNLSSFSKSDSVIMRQQ